jgi:predicted ATP-grasp superfamily ATP-dependent carboligase
MHASLEPEAYRTLVLDVDGQAGLQVVRSLGKRGVPVTAADSVRNSLGGLSRYADDTVVCPDVVDAPDEFVDWLTATLERDDYFAVVPVRDETSMVVSWNKPRLADTGATVGIEDWERTRTVYDKARTFELADSLDIPTPETHAPASFDDVDRIADDLPYPVVIKSRSKHVWDGQGRLQRHLVGDGSYVRGPAQLRETYRHLLARDDYLRAYPPLVQEYVEGRTTTTVGLAHDGRVCAGFQELRLRTTPASGGASTLIRGYRDQRMYEYAAELLETLQWTGPVQVEFMHTPAGEYYLVEVNGRYWGSLPLAVASGVDIPWLHFCQLCGHSPSSPPVFRDDVVHQRLFYGEFRWLAEQLSGRRPEAVTEVVSSLLTDSPVFFSLSDPAPTVGILLKAGRKGIGRLFDQVSGARDTVAR